MSPEASPNGYPREYRMSRGWWVFLLILGPLMVGGGAAAIAYQWSVWMSRSLANALALTAVMILVIALGACAAVVPFVYRFTLHSDSFTVKSLFPTRTLQPGDTRGYRRSPTWPRMITFYPRDEKTRPWAFTLVQNADAAFWEWLARFPDLDKQDLEATEQEILNDSEVGPTPEARMQRLRAAKKRTKIFKWVAGLVLVWGVLYAEPHAIVIPLMMLVPFVAILMVASAPGLYDLDGKPNTVRPSLSKIFFFAGPILAMRATYDLNVLTWQSMAIWVAVGAIGITAFLAGVSRDLRKRPLLLLLSLITMAMYSGGVVAETNALLDRSDPQVFRVAVLDKRETKRDKYYLKVAAWGPRDEPNQLSVRPAFYNSTKPGTTVCISLWPGALEIPWYTVKTCR